jgi:hypothetical protein
VRVTNPPTPDFLGYLLSAAGIVVAAIAALFAYLSWRISRRALALGDETLRITARDFELNLETFKLAQEQRSQVPRLRLGWANDGSDNFDVMVVSNSVLATDPRDAELHYAIIAPTINCYNDSHYTATNVTVLLTLPKELKVFGEVKLPANVAGIPLVQMSAEAYHNQRSFAFPALSRQDGTVTDSWAIGDLARITSKSVGKLDVFVPIGIHRLEWSIISDESRSSGTLSLNCFNEPVPQHD